MKFYIEVIKAYWKHLNGRWFVWRDTPIDVVVEAAALHKDALDDEQEGFLRGAVNELKRRSDRETP
jgi:hypothetical protein